MGTRRDVSENGVVGFVTIYNYGKMFSPAVPQTRKGRGDQRSNFGSVDRPGLISKIHNLLEIHRRLRKRHDITGNTKCSVNIHKALVKAIRMCFEQKIRESKLFPVGNLFLELFLCEGNSYALFSILFDSHVTLTSHLMNAHVNILYPNHMAIENREAFEYYLQHISNVKFKNSNHRVDLVNHEIDQDTGETPLTVAIKRRDPALVLTLLRYGADPFYTPQSKGCDESMQNPAEQLVDDLNGLFLFKNTGFSQETRAKLAAVESQVWEILSYFRRAVPGIPLTSTNHIITTSSEADSDIVEYVDDRFLAKQMYGIHPRIAETIDIDFFKPTYSLKHLSRCAIREHLKDNHSKVTSIPRGISMLPLPAQLKAYLDLQVD